MERTERSFIKNAKERKERNVLLKRMDAQPCVQYTLSTLRTRNKCIFFSVSVTKPRENEIETNVFPMSIFPVL